MRAFRTSGMHHVQMRHDWWHSGRDPSSQPDVSLSSEPATPGAAIVEPIATVQGARDIGTVAPA